jgi:hypothetical protein
MSQTASPTGDAATPTHRRRPSRRASKPARARSSTTGSVRPKHVTKDSEPSLEPTPMVPHKRPSKPSRRPSRKDRPSTSVPSLMKDPKSGISGRRHNENRRHSATDEVHEVMRLVSSSSIQSTTEPSSSASTTSRSTKSLRRRRMSRGARVPRKSLTPWTMPIHGLAGRGAKMIKDAAGPRRVLSSLGNTLQHVRTLNRGTLSVL